MKLEYFYELYPDFRTEKSELSHGCDGHASYWNALADAPMWLVTEVHSEWRGGADGDTMDEFMNARITHDRTITEIVCRVRKALGRMPAQSYYRYTRRALARELESIAASAMDDGETYAPQNAWAMALYQAAAIIVGDEHRNDDAIRKCNEQYMLLEMKSMADGCDPNTYERM